MNSYSVRTVYRWPDNWPRELTYIYEERITLWQAASLEEAIELAEEEAERYIVEYRTAPGYSPGKEIEYLGFAQGFWMFKEILSKGEEAFSLLRESDLEPDEYLDTFFDTGFEHNRDAEQTVAGSDEPNP